MTGEKERRTGGVEEMKIERKRFDPLIDNRESFFRTIILQMTGRMMMTGELLRFDDDR